jgi:hypothetical protein
MGHRALRTKKIDGIVATTVELARWLGRRCDASLIREELDTRTERRGRRRPRTIITYNAHHRATRQTVRRTVKPP